MTRTHKNQNGTCHTRVRFLNEQSEFRNRSSGVLLLVVREEKSGNVIPELIFLTSHYLASLENVHRVSCIDKNYSLWRKRIKKKEIKTIINIILYTIHCRN